MLFPPVICGNHIGLVIGKENHIRPFLHDGSNLFAQLHLPTVIGSHFIRLFKFPHFCMCGHYHIHTGVDDISKSVQQPSEFFLEVCISFPVAEILDAFLLVLVYNGFGTDHLCPVGSIQYQRLADTRGSGNLLNLAKKLLPGLRLWCPLHVHVVGAPLCINEYRIREVGSEGGLSDSLRAIDNYLLRFYDPPAHDTQH